MRSPFTGMLPPAFTVVGEFPLTNNNEAATGTVTEALYDAGVPAGVVPRPLPGVPRPLVDLIYRLVARGTPGMSGADLANLCNEAALMAARRNARVVEMQDFEKAKDKIFMGPERKSMVMPEEERRNTAYHESGHALIGKLLPKCDPVHKVTIIPRGRSNSTRPVWALDSPSRAGSSRPTVAPSPLMAFAWYRSEPLAGFANQTR